jgi:hypothetical protein
VKRTSSMNKLHTFPYDRALEYLWGRMTKLSINLEEILS